MIRHWCDAMEDHNPAYTDPEFAARSVHGSLVAPPAMLNAWLMPGLPGHRGGAESPTSTLLRKLDAAGFTSVVATDSEHEYLRYLRLGDQLVSEQHVEDVSPEKQTALGVGHFFTTVTSYRTPEGEEVGRMRFRMLKFRPGTGRIPESDAAPDAPRPARPHPGISRDTRFFWDGLKEGELRIQRCPECSALHHPPMVRCPGCGSYDLVHTVASGRGRVYSFVEPVHPKVAAFDYPLVVGLVELEEGTRLLSNIVDVDPERVSIGMPVECVFREFAPELTLPLFRPIRPERREETLRANDVSEGQLLDPCPIDLTTTLIVAAAIASRDYQDVHHDRDLAVKRGSPDIFMNILTTSGLCARYVTDWAGPEARLRSLRIRLGAPNYPGDVMTLGGHVERCDPDGTVELSLRGANRLGNHAIGRVELCLPTRAGR
jgi:uncharacterized OB-fold protein/acyl dehydratase